MRLAVKVTHVLMVITAAAAVASAIGARRAAAAGARVSPEAVAFHGAAELYRNLALWFGKQALRAEAAYWKEVGQA